MLVKMSSGIFTLELSKITIETIRAFREQGIAEGLRVEYKEDFPQDIERTICAFANSEGGIILIGVQADRNTNKPVSIPGIELKSGLEEKVVNICLSHISPTIMPEVKVCDFKSSPDKTESDRAVLFIRVHRSYMAPHYLINTNEILVRVHNRNSRADLRTIEALINRREKAKSAPEQITPYLGTKEITIATDVYQSVVICPVFPLDNRIHFNKENNERLFNVVNNVLTLTTSKPRPWHLELLSYDSSGRITRYCRVSRNGRIAFQRTATVENSRLYMYPSIRFLMKALKAAREIYPHFGFYGELAVGLIIVGTQNLLLGFPANRYLDRDYRCEKAEIFINRTIQYDELFNFKELIQDIINEFCLYFGLELNKEIISEIADELMN